MRAAAFLKGKREGCRFGLRNGPFPVTLYKEQWLKLLGISEQIKQFIQDNDSLLKAKEQG